MVQTKEIALVLIKLPLVLCLIGENKRVCRPGLWFTGYRHSGNVVNPFMRITN